MAYGAWSHNKTDDRESLLSILKDVSPNRDNYFVTHLGVGPAATNTLHEWGVYNTTRPTSVSAVIEGAAASYGDLTTPSRTNNRTSIVTEDVRVSGTAKAIDTITGEDSFAFQKKEALKRLKAKMEWLTINGVVASGLSGVGSQMAGFDGMISTNVTARNSGTSFTETELNDMLEDSYDAVGSQYIADLLVCPMVISRRISGFTSNLTRNIDASAKKLINNIRVYDSQVGQEVIILPHKDVRKTNVSYTLGNALAVYALREETWQHAFLAGREPKWNELAMDGDRMNGQYVAEFTLVGYAQRASVKRTGYNNVL